MLQDGCDQPEAAGDLLKTRLRFLSWYAVNFDGNYVERYAYIDKTTTYTHKLHIGNNRLPKLKYNHG